MSFLFINKTVHLNNLKTRTAINAKISVFVIWNLWKFQCLFETNWYSWYSNINLIKLLTKDFCYLDNRIIEVWCLTHHNLVLLLYTPWKNQKNFRFSSVFRRFRKATPGCNGLMRNYFCLNQYVPSKRFTRWKTHRDEQHRQQPCYR